MTRHKRLGGVHDGFYSALFHRPAAGGSSLFEDLVGILREAAGDAEVRQMCLPLSTLRRLPAFWYRSLHCVSVAAALDACWPGAGRQAVSCGLCLCSVNMMLALSSRRLSAALTTLLPPAFKSLLLKHPNTPCVHPSAPLHCRTARASGSSRCTLLGTAWVRLQQT